MMKRPTKALLSAVALTIPLVMGHAVAGEEPRTNKILLGTHIGDATIISLAGVDTDQAVVKFTLKLDDLIEDCSRNLATNDDGSIDSAKVADCATLGLKQEHGRVWTRRAVC